MSNTDLSVYKLAEFYFRTWKFSENCIFPKEQGVLFFRNSRLCPGRGTADLSLAGMEWAGFQLSRPKKQSQNFGRWQRIFFFENHKTTVDRRLLIETHKRHMQRALGTYSSR